MTEKQPSAEAMEASEQLLVQMGVAFQSFSRSAKGIDALIDQRTGRFVLCTHYQPLPEPGAPEAEKSSAAKAEREDREFVERVAKEKP